MSDERNKPTASSQSDWDSAIADVKRYQSAFGPYATRLIVGRMSELPEMSGLLRHRTPEKFAGDPEFYPKQVQALQAENASLLARAEAAECSVNVWKMAHDGVEEKLAQMRDEFRCPHCGKSKEKDVFDCEAQTAADETRYLRQEMIAARKEAHRAQKDRVRLQQIEVEAKRLVEALLPFAKVSLVGDVVDDDLGRARKALSRWSRHTAGSGE